MACTHFNVPDGVNLIPDEICTEFETLATAEQDAAHAAVDSSSHKLRDGDACQAVVEVSDEHHRLIDPLTPLPQALSPWAA